MKIILASASPRRKKLLKELGIRFSVIPSNIQEKTKYTKPHLIVKDISKKKALSVASKFPNAVVIAADTIVYCNGNVIGKPSNKKQAEKYLKIQSGKWQSVYTGITVVFLKRKIIITEYEKSKCYMRKLSQQEIKKIASRHLDKAGGWAVQDKNDRLITKIKGDYTNIVGFPIKLVKKMLKKVKCL